MAPRSILRLFLVFLLISSSSIFMTACTSSDEDQSVLEDELENLENAQEEGDFSDEEDEELQDDLEEEGGDLADLEEDELEDELDEDSLDDEDEDLSSEDEFAELDGDDDFDEADEKALAKELGEEQNYPVAQNPQAQFPEEVVNENYNPPQGEGMNAPIPPQASHDAVTSETTEIDFQEIPEPVAVPKDDLGMADPINPEEVASSSAQSWVPVVKVKTDPFYRNQRLMNAVYIARPKDNISNISEKIFGDDKSKELDADNPHLAKGIDPGDKIYYNSPNRPDDRSALKVYYDDIGLEAQTYVTGAGENIRRLGSKLLGFPDGWKEVWAINPSIDSKTILPSGTQIRYWTGEEQSQQMQQTLLEEPAGEEVAQKAQVEEVPPQEPPTQTPVDPGPPPTPIVSELPPEPPLPEASLAENDELGALDPEAIPEIEPLPEDMQAEPPGQEIVATPPASQGNSLVTIGAMALLILGGAALVAIQIKNRKAQTQVTPPSLEYTQV